MINCTQSININKISQIKKIQTIIKININDNPINKTIN